MYIHIVYISKKQNRFIIAFTCTCTQYQTTVNYFCKKQYTDMYIILVVPFSLIMLILPQLLTVSSFYPFSVLPYISAVFDHTYKHPARPSLSSEWKDEIPSSTYKTNTPRKSALFVDYVLPLLEQENLPANSNNRHTGTIQMH